MNDHVRRCNKEEEFYFKEGCFIIEISNSSTDPEISIAHARVEQGKSTRWHWLNDTYERYVIMEGKGIVEVGAEKPTTVSVGDVVLIPPQTKQRITNVGDGDLKFLAICTPRFNHINYHHLEEHLENET